MTASVIHRSLLASELRLALLERRRTAALGRAPHSRLHTQLREHARRHAAVWAR